MTAGGGEEREKRETKKKYIYIYKSVVVANKTRNFRPCIIIIIIIAMNFWPRTEKLFKTVRRRWR